ncbi:PiggyBac transposable element-derived protein [Trinorchestia longiramus]|nr:PiggyBac transposable element-derived protein [Trinorchestia longiramus]
MKCLENCSGIKLYNWRDTRNVFMISTVPEHDGSLIPSGKTNRNGEELKKPQCVLDYNNAKKGVDISNQMTSYHTALRRSLKWHRKVAIEIITGMSVVNAHVLYNKYFADAPMSIRHFRESLVLSLTGIVEKNIRPGRSCKTLEQCDDLLLQEMERIKEQNRVLNKTYADDVYKYSSMREQLDARLRDVGSKKWEASFPLVLILNHATSLPPRRKVTL